MPLFVLLYGHTPILSVCNKLNRTVNATFVKAPRSFMADWLVKDTENIIFGRDGLFFYLI